MCAVHRLYWMLITEKGQSCESRLLSLWVLLVQAACRTDLASLFGEFEMSVALLSPMLQHFSGLTVILKDLKNHFWPTRTRTRVLEAEGRRGVDAVILGTAVVCTASQAEYR